MSDTTVDSINHSKHPLKIVHSLIKHVWSVICALGNLHIEILIELRVNLRPHKHRLQRDSRVDCVLAIITRVVPATRRSHNRTSFSACTLSRRVDNHIHVGMSSFVSITLTMKIRKLLCAVDTATPQVESLVSPKSKIIVCLRRNSEIIGFSTVDIYIIFPSLIER